MKSSGDLRARPRVGSFAWEKAGGPPLSVGQRAGFLAGSARVLLRHSGEKLVWLLRQQGLLARREPGRVDLAAWAPPDSRAARQAEEQLRDMASGPMVHHSFRSYYFSAIACEAARAASVDREALYVAVLLHDVGLFDRARPAGEHCFTVSGARVARRIAGEAGWDEARCDSIAVAITANLNPDVSLGLDGPVAHFFSQGGLMEVLAQEWKLHPDNLREILARHPRTGFAADTARLVSGEARQHPGCRFACLGPIFPTAVRWSRFSEEAAAERV